MILTSRGGPDCATTSSDAGLPITPWRVSGDVPTTTVPGSPSNLSVNGVSSDCGPRQAMVSPALTVHESGVTTGTRPRKSPWWTSGKAAQAETGKARARRGTRGGRGENGGRATSGGADEGAPVRK